MLVSENPRTLIGSLERTSVNAISVNLLEMGRDQAIGGRLTNLKGGLPIVVEGITIGGIGVGSQTGDEDLEVARAGVAALAGAATFD